MKRRLDLASALVHEPDVLFLDEPTTGLDPASRLTVWDEVRRINERGTTVFLTTQYLEEADQLCDRLAIIDDGLIVREGTPDRAEGRAARAPRSWREATLDDVFLDATGRTRTHVAGEVQEVTAMTYALRARHGARCARASRTPEALVPDAVHPALLPRRQRRPGGKDLPGLVDRVPARPGLRRVPAAELAAARRVVRERSAVPRRGDRGRLLRQAARDARPAQRDRARPADRRRRQGAS